MATVGKDVLTAIFMPAIHRATCYFSVKAQEVADGKWEISWTSDMEAIKREGTGNGDAGGADPAEADGESAD